MDDVRREHYFVTDISSSRVNQNCESKDLFIHHTQIRGTKNIINKQVIDLDSIVPLTFKSIN